MSIPKVSVIMPVYNGARYVRNAVDSILNQTYENFEMIVVDDASEDGTNEILSSYRDERLRLFCNNNNLGLAKSLNHAIKVSRGEYIARQDADDISHIQRLEGQVSFLDNNSEIAVLGTTTQWIDENGQTLLVWQQPTENKRIQQTLLTYCCLIHGSVMYRAQIVRDMGGYNENMRTGQDYDLWLRVSETHDIACLPEVLYMYRRHAEMASITNGQEQSKNAQEALIRAIERRKAYPINILRSQQSPLTLKLSSMSRNQLAQRYSWWSSGARWIDKKLVLRFIFSAILFDPMNPEIWIFVKEVLFNKIRSAKKRILHRG
jgi:glycosyltransferase involved in cell wall biosynthesis